MDGVDWGGEAGTVPYSYPAGAGVLVIRYFCICTPYLVSVQCLVLGGWRLLILPPAD